MVCTRHAVFTGAGLVGLATAATSAVSLYRLAEQCAIDPWLAASLPIALDAGAAVGALAWITERGPARAWGRGIAVGSLVASLAGNGIQHAVTAHLLHPNLMMVLAVGATIPGSLWAVVHLAALMTRAAPARVKSPEKRGVRTPAPSTTPAPAGPAPTTADAAPRSIQAERTATAERVAWLLDQPPAPFSEEVSALRQQFDVSASTAKRIRRAAGRGAA
jgi:hypothetical protein